MTTPEQTPQGQNTTSAEGSKKQAPRDIDKMVELYYARQGKSVEPLDTEKEEVEESKTEEFVEESETHEEEKSDEEALEPEEVDTIPEEAVRVYEANETNNTIEATEEEESEGVSGGNGENTKEDNKDEHEAQTNDTEAKQRREEAREDYKEHREKIDEAREEFMSATGAYWQAKKDLGFLEKINIFDSTPVQEEEKAMLEAQEKYDKLLDEIRDKRQERIDAYVGVGKEMSESEKARYTKLAARHEALLDRHIDNEVQLLESLRFNKNEKGESRNWMARNIKKGWNLYKNCPRKKRLLIASGFAGVAGIAFGPGLTVTGLVAGGVAAGTRYAGGFFGTIAGAETKRFGDKVAEKSGKKKLEKQKAQFGETALSKSRKERLKINKDVRTKKHVATGGAVVAGVAVGGGIKVGADMTVDAVADGAFSPKSAHAQTYNEIEGKSETNTPPEQVDENATQEADVETKSVEESEVEGVTTRENIPPSEGTPEVTETAREETPTEELDPEEIDTKNMYPDEVNDEAKSLTNEKTPTEELDPEEIDTKDLYKPVEDEADTPETQTPENAHMYMAEAGDSAQFEATEHVRPRTHMHMAEAGDSAVFEDTHTPEAGDLPTPSDEEVHMPEAGDTADLHESKRLADVEIADLYSRFREGIEEPEELKMEGVYEKGSSVERELQQFLEGNDWIEEHYPDITDTQKGEIAHRIRLALEEHPDMEEKLHIQNGDWNKVLADDSYSFYVDRELVEQEIEDVLGISEQTDEVPVLENENKTPIFDEQEKTKVFDETNKTAPEPEDVPVVNDEDKTPTVEESTPVEHIEPEKEKVLASSEASAEAVIDDEIKDIPEETEDINKVPEEPTPVIEETPQETEISEAQSKSVAEESLNALRETEEGAEETETQSVETTKEPTLTEDLAQVKETLRKEGVDYQGLQTRPYIEQFFKDGVFEHSALQGQYQEIRSNWGIISQARMEDIFDANKSLTFKVDDIPLTMGANTEAVCRSIAQQLDGTVSNFEELLNEAQEKNSTLGEFVAQIGEEIENTAREVPESVVEVPTVSLDEVTEVPAVQELDSPKTIDGVTKTHEVALPRLEMDDIKDSTHDYMKNEYNETYDAWSNGTAKELYEHDATFKKVFDIELIDTVSDVHNEVPLAHIAVDWSAFEGLTPIEALEQLHELENRFEEINATDTIFDPNTTTST